MTIDTFSFRYADTAGFMEWFRYNPAQGLWIDRCDGAMQAKRCRMTEEELAELDDCLIRLNTLLEKFAAAEDIASCGDFPEL